MSQGRADPELFAFIREELRSASNLVVARLRALDPADGTVFPLLPSGSRGPSDPHAGGVGWSSRAEKIASLGKAVGVVGDGGFGRQFTLFVDPLARFGDRIVRSRRPHLYLGTAVGYPAHSRPMEISEFDRAERWAAGHQAVGLIVNEDVFRFPNDGSQLDEPTVDRMIAATDGFLVSAFDAESWIIWSRE